jgi:hypothetical protein
VGATSASKQQLRNGLEFRYDNGNCRGYGRRRRRRVGSYDIIE